MTTALGGLAPVASLFMRFMTAVAEAFGGYKFEGHNFGTPKRFFAIGEFLPANDSEEYQAYLEQVSPFTQMLHMLSHWPYETEVRSVFDRICTLLEGTNAAAGSSDCGELVNRPRLGITVYFWMRACIAHPHRQVFLKQLALCDRMPAWVLVSVLNMHPEFGKIVRAQLAVLAGGTFGPADWEDQDNLVRDLGRWRGVMDPAYWTEDNFTTLKNPGESAEQAAKIWANIQEGLRQADVLPSVHVDDADDADDDDDDAEYTGGPSALGANGASDDGSGEGAA
jgi:hypothetical protein